MSETYGNSVADEIVRQSLQMESYNFLCKDCVNHLGGCGCAKGVFVAFEGANLSNCVFYKHGRICPHCGRIS